MAKMIDWLILTEKPDQARQFEKALQLSGSSTPYLDGIVKIVNARGRLYDFAVPDIQNNAKYGRNVEKAKQNNIFAVSNDVAYRSDRDRLANMPVLLNSRPDGKIKYEYVDANAAQIGDEIVGLLKSASNILVATDWDIEGELIFNDLVTVNELGPILDWNHVYRIHTASLDVASILESLDNIQVYGSATGSSIPDIEKMVSQGYARSIADYEFGYTFSFYNEMLKRQLDLQFKGGLGRLKLSVLNAILDQENVVSTQDLRQKYNIVAKLPGNIELQLDDEYLSIHDAENYMSGLPKEVIVSVQEGAKNILAPELYTRTSYIVNMDRYHDSLDWGRPLQSAYETYSSVSYPRTNSAYVNMREFNKLRDLVTSHNVQERLAQRILERGYNNLLFNKLKPRHKYVNNGIVDNMPHHAIIPTCMLDQIEFDRMDAHGDSRAKEAYLDVFYHTMAIFAENGIDEGQLLKLVDKNTDDSIVTGLKLRTKELGWRKLIDGPVYDDLFYEGPIDEPVPVEYMVVEKSSIIEENYDHPTLLSYLNKNNVGTESTREPVINDLKHMNMISLDDHGRYHVNESVSNILRVIRVEDWIDFSKLNNWDSDLDKIENMHDAMSFIQAQRKSLMETNKKVEKWYDSSQ